MSGSYLGSPTMPSLDVGDTAIPGLDAGDASGCMWDNDLGFNSTFSVPLSVSSVDCESRVQEVSGDSSTQFSRDEENEDMGGFDTLSGQLMKLSMQATRATIQLKRTGSSTPLTVHSLAVGEALETADTLMRIINSIPLANDTSISSELFLGDENGEQPFIDHGLVFMALASHQHVLALFRAICDSIDRSIESAVARGKQPRGTLHGSGVSSAQFAMVLKLIMHLLKRIGQSLRMERQNDTSQVTDISLSHPYDLTFGLGGIGSSCGSQRVVDTAQHILRTLPGEHVKLAQVAQGLEIRIDQVLCIC